MYTFLGFSYYTQGYDSLDGSKNNLGHFHLHNEAWLCQAMDRLINEVAQHNLLVTSTHMSYSLCDCMRAINN